MSDFTIENINPEDVYTDKELQNNYTRLTSNGETVAVIIPFHKSQNNSEDMFKTINISELIDDKNNTEKTVENEEENSYNKEMGDFRKRLMDKQFVDMSDGEGGQVYSQSSFDLTTIDKI